MVWRRLLLLTKKASPLFVSPRPFKAGSSISGLRTRGASSGVTLHSVAQREVTATMDSPLVLRLLANGMSVAERAATIVRDVMAKGELEIVEKTGAADLQTKADRAAQDCIVNSIRAAFPGLTVIGEEGEEHISAPETLPADWIVRDLHPDGLKLKTPERLAGATLDQITVWVDPLDGTKEYTEGFLDHVTILIGIAVGREAVAGVINQPFHNFDKPGATLGRTVAGMVGAGVIGLKRTLPPQGERIITTTRSHGMGLINDSVEACKPTKVRFHHFVMYCKCRFYPLYI
jgi:3'(2'), 5'-bisphosphate nucleotidase